MQIAGREISNKLPPYIIAEISGNHGGSLNQAIALIKAAKDAGADAVKFQCFEAGRLTLDCDKPDFILKDGPWKGRRLYDLYAATETPRAWFPELFAHAREIGITPFSSVFSPEDVDFLERLDCPAYKIASMEITDVNLIAHAAKTDKPLIISTGMANNHDLHSLVYKFPGASFLHCISGYPTPVEDANLGTFYNNRWCFDGISDHTLGWTIPVAATALGAIIIEKHLCLMDPMKSWDEQLKTEDSEFSLDQIEFKDMMVRVKQTWQAMQPSERKSEESSRQARRSLYVVKDIKSGEAFTTENVRSIRPAYGMPPKDLPMVLKSFAACDIERGTALEEGMILPF